MEKVVLKAEHRTVTGKQVGALRRQGKLPAVMYGHHVEPTPITLDLKETTRILNKMTSSSIVTIELDGKECAALVREKQKNFIRNVLLHVDFQVVDMTEKIRTHVSIEVIGTSPAVKDFNGVVVMGLPRLDIESLPQYLPERVTVDISNLKKIGDGIHVRDIVLAKEVEIFDDADEMIVMVSSTSDEEGTEEGAAGMEEPEVIEKGKKEEDFKD
jgi:large subunit ribosomal protein L25